VARGGARVDPNVGTYRVSQILAATPTGEHFVRPDDFDLAAHWRAYLADFAIRRHQEHATVRMSPLARQRMAHVMEPAIVSAVDASAGPADADGWVPARIPIESIRHAHDELLRLGAEVEVLAPAALRELLGRTAAALAARYDNPARDGTAPAQPVPVGS
jgi:predicted DNA-binding transcriptional regulator YafY